MIKERVSGDSQIAKGLDFLKSYEFLSVFPKKPKLKVDNPAFCIYNTCQSGKDVAVTLPVL